MLIVNQIRNIKNLEVLSYFDRNTLSQFFDLSQNSLSANVNRWLKSGILIQFKKGFYVTSAYVQAQRKQNPYMEFIAGKLREPSYLSLEYALQKYSVLTESVYGFTSVTLKSKRVYKNKFAVFVYRNIKEELFTGYTIKNMDGFMVKMATPAKALFDYFYYKLFRINEINKQMIDDFRLNYDGFSSKDLNEFSRYCLLAKTKKMRQLITFIKELEERK